MARADGELQSSCVLQLRRAERLLRSKMLFATYSSQYGQQGQHQQRTGAPWSVSRCSLEANCHFSLNLALLYYVFLLLILVAKGLSFQKLLDDILSPLSNLINSRWRPRWPPLPINDHNPLPVHHRKVIFVAIPRF